MINLYLFLINYLYYVITGQFGRQATTLLYTHALCPLAQHIEAALYRILDIL